MANRLAESEVVARLANLPGWKLEGGAIVRSFTLRDFPSALVFVGAVGHLAETAGHHPDITITYNKVRLALITHDAGGLTTRDFALASQINALLGVD